MLPAENELVPRVLLASCREWVSTAKLALSLAALGCDVDLVGPARHPALVTDAIKQFTPYRALQPKRSLLTAVRASPHDAVIPCDEVVLEQLLELASTDAEVANLMSRSLGDRMAQRVAGSRYALLEEARDLGIAVPQMMPLPRCETVAEAVRTLGLPLVLKSDASFGGQGVRIAHTESEAKRAWKALHDAPGMVRALKRGFVDDEWNHVLSSLRRTPHTVSAQKCLPGDGGERTAMAVAVDGEMRACLVFEVVRSWALRGAASVLRLVHDATIERELGWMIERLKLRGFVGADYKPDPVTGQQMLLEMNLRPTQLVHLPLGVGSDLVAEFVRGVLNAVVEDRPVRVNDKTIALFPQELMRDPTSAFVHGSAFHDVPWEAPGLVAEMLRRSRLNVLPEDLQ